MIFARSRIVIGATLALLAASFLIFRCDPARTER